MTKEQQALARIKDNTFCHVSQDYDMVNLNDDYNIVENFLKNTCFTTEELDFLIDYCYKHIADCEEMTYSCSEENCKLLGVYDNLKWYEALKDKLNSLK